MYLDFDDHRPDVPRVPRAVSGRAGATLSVALHVGVVLVILLAPSYFAPHPALAPAVAPPREPIRFVSITPRIDRSLLPSRPAEHSDRDRRAATRDRAPDARNAMPLARGNTSEKIEGTSGARAIEPEPAPAPATAAAARPEPPAVTAPPAATRPATEIPIEAPASEKPAPDLAASIRNLRQFFQTQNFDNPQGGQGDQSADIQFDSRGVDFGPWLRRFKLQVERNWFIPQAAWIARGRVVVQFLVHRDGRITDLRVVQPSNVNSFNAAAANAIKMSNPTLALPAEYPVDHVLFTVTFHYNDRE
jgi:TonB family protein